MGHILVTGGAGFLGSHVVEELLGLGHKVVAFDDLSASSEGNLPAGAEFIKGTITDVDLIKNVFASYQFDYVFHFAAFPAEGLSHFAKHHNYNVNVLGSATLINEAVKQRQVRGFVFASSVAVYGNFDFALTESLTPSPIDPYGIAKLAIELDLFATKQMFGMPFIILRLHNIYGERQNVSDRYRNVVGIFLRQALTGESMTIFGDGKQTRAFTYVGDVAPHIARCIEIPEAYNEIINLGGEEVTSILALSNAVAQVTNTSWQVRHEMPRHEVAHTVVDHSKAHRILGFAPRVRLQEGLTKTFNWLRHTNFEHSGPSYNLEITQGLPHVWQKQSRSS